MSPLRAAAEYKKEGDHEFWIRSWLWTQGPWTCIIKACSSFIICVLLFVLAGVPSHGHYRLTYQKSQREHESCTKTSSDSPRPLKRQKITIDINLPGWSMRERRWAPLGISQARLQQRERGEIWGGRWGTGGAAWHLSKDVYVNSEWPPVEGSRWLYR